MSRMAIPYSFDIMSMIVSVAGTLLTLVFLMRCLNMRTYFSDIITLLHKLESIDSYRSGYFRDLSTYTASSVAVDCKSILTLFT